MISFIWAMDQNQLIGKENGLPWRLPEDLKYFKKTTDGHGMVMGRKTFDSIGKPLPNRENVILTKNTSFQPEGCLVLHSVDDVLNWAEERESEIFIMGGREIYKQFIPHVDKLYVTEIHHEFEGDTTMPSIPWENFTCISSMNGKKDEKNPFNYEFKVYVRK
ncbi:dihydrofolate reductase [Bacillus sp. BHET2]|uniref:dihydrofolate reductase n=1 Tax=Bacillus sp. BHET2 TaxID=2583818 RepID=UPI00110F3848|nr:dihydrofolate reductase [Bacillus sp. BHET2]TMU86840.1 dihydrofolate reductase [Bacillus sp. BHET2]